MEQKFVGVILAGGQSRRFGAPKAFAQKDGIDFYQYSINAITPLIDSILIVTNSTLKDEFLKKGLTNIVTDINPYQGCGPLAGLLTAMETIHAEWYITAPVDVPFINESVYMDLMEQVASDAQAIVPVTATGRIQPLIAIYHYSLKNFIRHQLEKKEYAPKKLFQKVRVKYVEMDSDKSFLNINRLEDYQKHI